MSSVLDVAKISDVLVLVVSVEADQQELIDSHGDAFLTAIKAQGVPSLIVVLSGLHNAGNAKKQNELKKRYTKWVKDQFPGSFEPRIVVCDSDADGRNLSRWIHEERARTISWREKRSYMAVERFEFLPNQQQQQQMSSDTVATEATGTLVVHGYLRGQSLSANQLVHLCHFGTFQIEKITQPVGGDPHPLRMERRSKGTIAKDDTAMMVTTSSTENEHIMDRPNAEQEQLQWCLEPSEIANEQTWPTKEEMLKALTEASSRTKKKKVPKGFSEYQAAWIVDEDNEDGDDNSDAYDDDDVYDEEDEDMIDDDDDVESMRHFNMDTQSVATTAMGDAMFSVEDDEQMTEAERAAEREEFLRRKEEQEEQQMFPDEMETPVDIPARIRFQRFRGLKSFRNSPWDPKENLPIDYSRIFQFENFERSQKLAFKDHSHNSIEYVQAEQYVSIHVRDVPSSFVSQYQLHCTNSESSESNLLLLFSLMRHEQKMSVVHLQIKKHPSYEDPVKSKDPLLVQIGFRSFLTRPIFSEHNPRCDKHRYERYLQPGRFLVASIYAPVTYRPAPVLIYHPKTHELIATGSVMSVDPDRIMLKKIVLTGYPLKVHKRQAVVRFMFYNPDDVRWFKPVELHTKLGRVGVIKEPLGTHGYMKCLFDDKIMAHDTVCMNLYKRVYPKFNRDCQRSLLSIKSGGSSSQERRVMFSEDDDMMMMEV